MEETIHFWNNIDALTLQIKSSFEWINDVPGPSESGQVGDKR